MGAGRTELLTALYGAAAAGAGAERRDRRRAGAPLHDRAARAGGLGLRHRRPARQRTDAARQRRAQSRHLGAAQRLADLLDVARAGSRSSRARPIQALRRPPAAAGVPVGALSGGNQQKVVLAKEVLGSRACCCSTSRRAASTSAPRARSTPAFAACRAGARRADRLERNAGAARPLRPGRRACASGRTVAEFPGGADEHEVLAAPRRARMRPHE